MLKLNCNYNLQFKNYNLTKVIVELVNTVWIIFEVVNDIMETDVGSNDASKEADGEHNHILYTSTK